VVATRYPGAGQFLPTDGDLEHLREAAAACHGCDLWEHATQTVFGEGRPDAPMMLVGEQPGDQGDRQGHPFVGPAGRVLDEALERAGIVARLYVTNAVKHFRFEERGKRRIHQKPSRGQMVASAPWQRAELEAVSPDVLVLLGATADLRLAAGLMA
jgi:DNA polymerase